MCVDVENALTLRGVQQYPQVNADGDAMKVLLDCQRIPAATKRDDPDAFYVERKAALLVLVRPAMAKSPQGVGDDDAEDEDESQAESG